jgi:hypothetical protein
MCKHSKKTVEKLTERQRGLDARGNDPLATRRESSWATEFVKNPPQAVLDDTLDYLEDLPDTINNKAVRGMDTFKQALTGFKQGANGNPTGMEFTEFFADKKKSGFKGMMDEVGFAIEDVRPDLKALARDQPFFTDRGRLPPPRERRQSIQSRHGGITTGADRTTDTLDLYQQDLFHAKGQFRLQLDSGTVQKFQKSGAPYIAGASGTMQFVALSMEQTGSVDQATSDERDKRERVIAMLAAQHVAIGHHSMAECLVSVQCYGYFKDVPDPLTDYDGAMKALDKRLQALGFNGGKPLSRETENQAKSKEQVEYEDRLSFVRSLNERYRDQLAPNIAKVIQASMDKATNEGGRAFYDQALAALARAEQYIRTEEALITAKARGNNHVLRPDELVAKMGAAPKRKKSDSVEYKAVMEALANYDQKMKELAGRKLNHDQAELGFEELRSALAVIDKAAKAYKANYANKAKRAGRVGVMDELIPKLAREQSLLSLAEEKCDTANLLEHMTIEQAVEFQRFGIDLTNQAMPRNFKEDDIANKQVLGSGGISTVMLIDYREDDEHPAEQFAFKPEPETITTHETVLEGRGIDPKKPKFGKRNIATKKMADAAGLGHLIPNATFATVDGKVGLMMEKAGGESPAKRVKTVIQNPDQMDDLKNALAAKNRNDRNWKKQIPEKNGRGMRYGYDETNGQFTVEALRASTFPLDSPPAKAEDVAALQEQLIDLQWLDAFCGQTDRHAENYLIDTSSGTPTVKGIDNDFSFGTKQTDPGQKQSSYPGFPPIIDQQTFDNFKAMKWPDIAKSLTGELDQDEINAAKDRFDAIQAKLDQLEQDGMVVQSWTGQVNGKSITEILGGPGNFTNYYKRDAEYQKIL